MIGGIPAIGDSCWRREMDVSPYRGIGQFGAPYRRMYENDVHSPGSVDRSLLEDMVRVCAETADHLYSGFTPTGLQYERASRPQLEGLVAEITSACRTEEERVEAIARFCCHLAEKEESTNLEQMVFGGKEEDIVARGSDWCTDVARVACVMCQIGGTPARLVFLADIDAAYSGHAIIEAHRGGRWGAVDPLRDVVYRQEGGRPASTWDLICERRLNKAAAIANYFVWEHERYDYATSSLSDYYRSILRMASEGWPGGLRWLHGEDKG